MPKRMIVHRDIRVPCSFCGQGHTAIAVCQVSIPQGCAARKDDRIQCLCIQHVLSAEPRGDMKLTEVYSLPDVQMLQRDHGRFRGIDLDVPWN